MDHTAGFLKVVNAARPKVKEISLADAQALLEKNPKIVLLDVREDGEWQAGHAAQAVHLGRGVLERDIETRYPDTNTEFIMYCGGGYRSILAADIAQRMGYKNIFSLAGGYKALVQAKWPTKTGVS